MASLTASKLNLIQCLTIKENQYRSSDNKRDYQKEEVDARIYLLLSRKSESKIKQCLKALDEGLDAMMDWQSEPPDFILVENNELQLIPPIIMGF